MKVDYSLYLVTNSINKSRNEFLDIIEASLQGGVSLLQIREKDISTLNFYELASELKCITSSYDVPIIINDRVDIALAIDADGVHVGQEDMPANIVRNLLGEDKIIGVSAATIDEAKKAEEDGADYVGVGAVFGTKTKENPTSVNIGYLNEICDSINIPTIAIGGINADNIDKLVGTGIKGIAVVSAIIESDKPKESSAGLLNKVKKVI